VHGKPCITEINAGRFANVSTIHDLAAKRNMAATYVRLAFGERVRNLDPRERAGRDQFVMRDLDALPRNILGSELYEGIERASYRAAVRRRTIDA